MWFINADDPNVIQMGSTEKQELNLYAYCVNDPVNSVDPTGYDAVFLLAKYGAYGFGHAALLVSANNQWYYFSLNGEDSGRTNYNLRWYGSKNSVNGFTSASTITGQLKKYSGLARHVYTHKIYIYGNFNQSYYYIASISKNIKYNLLTNNCSQVVCRALAKGTARTSLYTQKYRSLFNAASKRWIPNEAYTYLYLNRNYFTL